MVNDFSIDANFLFDLVGKLPLSEANQKDYVNHLLNGETKEALALLFLVLIDVNVLEEVVVSAQQKPITTQQLLHENLLRLSKEVPEKEWEKLSKELLPRDSSDHISNDFDYYFGRGE